MKIISWNVNGLRAVCRKGFWKWLKKFGADIVCLQEIKIQAKNLSEVNRNLIGSQSKILSAYNADKTTADMPIRFFNYADKPGYSGVAIFTKRKPVNVELNIGHKRFDSEGRFLRLDFKDFTLINLYLPHGGRDKKNLIYKLQVYKFLLEQLKKLKSKNIILIGDFNIAHTELDLARPKQNKNNIMFTPTEREQIDTLVELGFADTFRMFHKEENNYTWWPYFANARARNLGWRIDYCFTSKSLTPKVKSAFILPDVFGSDHCPVGIEIAH